MKDLLILCGGEGEGEGNNGNDTVRKTVSEFLGIQINKKTTWILDNNINSNADLIEDLMYATLPPVKNILVEYCPGILYKSDDYSNLSERDWEEYVNNLKRYMPDIKYINGYPELVTNSYVKDKIQQSDISLKQAFVEKVQQSLPIGGLLIIPMPYSNVFNWIPFPKELHEHIPEPRPFSEDNVQYEVYSDPSRFYVEKFIETVATQGFQFIGILDIPYGLDEYNVDNIYRNIRYERIVGLNNNLGWTLPIESDSDFPFMVLEKVEET